MAKGQKKKFLGVLAVLLVLCVIAVVAYFVLNNQNGTPEHTHEYSTEYKYDDSNHWFECECGEKSEQIKHTFTDGKCVCGYEKEEEHTHDFDEIKYDETHHWKECECGEKSEIEEHAFLDGKCECGYERKESGNEHTHNYVIGNYDDSKHWKECECSAKDQVERHTLVNGKCECGYEDKSMVHTHVFDRKTVNDEYLKSPATCENKAVYYYSCKCGEKGEETFENGNALGHSFTNYKDNGDNTKTAECDNGCGKTNTIQKEHVHSYSSVITPPTCEDEGYTTYTCGCGDTYRADEVKALGHNYGDFVSDGDGIHHTKTCKNDSDHKITESCGGGTATCTKKAKCSVCGGEYGSLAPHNYTHVVTPPTCEQGGYTTHTCVCGDSYVDSHMNAKGHAYGAWVNNGNETHTKTCANDNTHKITENCGGGTATCTKKANCSVCGGEYGSLASHSYTDVVTPPTCEQGGYTTHTCACGDSYVDSHVNAKGHAYGAWLNNGNKTHTKTCANDNTHKITENCGGGTATCTKKANCSVCGSEYGSLAPHSYTHVVTPPTCEQGGYTTHTCVCGDSYVDSHVNSKGHAYGAWVNNGNGTHTKTCASDNTHKITENCGGGTATCTKKANCSVCGGEYGSFKAHEYLNLEYNENYHWYECVCGDKTELIAHNGGSATCIKKAECTTCGQQYGEYGDHAYGAWISNDDGTHTKTCANDNTHKLTENCTDNGNGVCIYCNATLKEYVREGEKIYFGSYPQTEVTDSILKTTLNNLAGTLPTSSNSRNWMSYGYYISGSVQKNYMWYIDVTSSGEKYRGVYFSSYRPYRTTSSSSASNSRQYDNGYYPNTAYWFKYEPIEWRILGESGGNALIMANLILDSQAYQNECYYINGNCYTNSNGAPGGTYANNYKYSTIRSWLNDNFYNTAFSEIEKELINTVTVDNSAESTGYNTNEYACENTNDKVFLLSYKQVTNSAYGFSSNYSDNDPARRLKTTDYAQSQGCYTSTSTSYLGNGNWWLRSPRNDHGYYDRSVDYDGEVSDSYYNVNNTNDGVVPALQIRLS
ncbi:MAG: hypothetical protein IJC72_02390 [Clostridia bacterium]|nr:hypothetical protein [Clostridia bacterium]